MESSESIALRDRTEAVANQLKTEVVAAQDAALDAVRAAERDVARAAAKRDVNVKSSETEEVTEEEEELKRAVRHTYTESERVRDLCAYTMRRRRERIVHTHEHFQIYHTLTHLCVYRKERMR